MRVLSLNISSLFAGCLFAVIALALGTSTSLHAQSQNGNVYVCNQNSASISIINPNSLEIEHTIDLTALGFSENAKPHHAVVEPDGSHWYVSLIGENTVLKFNAANELVSRASLEVPGLMVVHPTDNVLFVGRSMSAVNPPQSFAVVDRTSMEVLDEVDLFFTRPHAIATLPNKQHVFVASLSSNQILTTDIESGDSELVTMDGMNHMFVNFAISPDEQTLVGTTQMTGKLLVFDIADPLSPELTNTLDVNAQPWHPVFSDDGKFIYFGNKEGNSITVVNAESLEIEKVITGEGLAQPHGAVLSHDNKYLFVTNNNMKMDMMKGGDHSDHSNHSMAKKGTVTVIDTETLEIIKVIEVGMNPTGIGTK